MSILFCSIAYSLFESLLITFMQQICTQLDILVKRLFQITNISNNIFDKVDIYEKECELIKECVNHHICIFS